MTVTHIAVNLRFRYERRHRVHDHDIDRSRTHHRFRDLQCLFPAVRLGYVKFININTDIPRIHRIQCVLRIDKSGNPPSFLNFRYHMQRHRRLTARLRPVNLYDPPFRDPAYSQRDIKTQRASRNSLHLHPGCGITKFHNRTFSVLLLDLRDRRLQRFYFILIFLHL